MEPGKPAIQSTTIVSGILAALAALAPLVGWEISATDEAGLRTVLESGVLVVSNLAAFVFAVIAVWGRYRATQQITGIVKPMPPMPPTINPPV